MHKVMGYEVDFTPEQVQEFLANCEYQYMEVDDKYWSGKINYIEVKLNAVWYRLGCTDLKDNVSTGGRDDRDIEPFRKKARNCYGGRIAYNGEYHYYSIIDAFSDG